jgi:malate dehydrogenase (oxaloacetate-decarboxylating)(NADP+)
MYLSIARRGKVKEILKNWPQKDVRFICVTDGGRILGLGDLGANGMGIPIGKLQLYTACAGVPPQYLLPMYLDAGTNNQQYLNDPLYLGMRRARPSAEELFSFVDEFMQAVQEVFPKCCVHFEDWTGVDAVHLLQRYREKYCVYNDDVQGTAGIVLAGMINAGKIKGTKLSDEKYLFLGAGSAGIGLANLLCSAMVEEGLTLQEAQSRVWLFDVNGLLESTRTDLVDFQTVYAHEHAPTRDFVSAIESIKPTTIIGVSTIGGAFTQRVIEAVSRNTERPVILALSNPTEHAECTPEQAYTWSNGKALYAAGVQFPPVQLNGRTFLPGQANNFYIFPAIGMAVFATRASRVTDQMFIEAARAVADLVSPDLLKQGLLYPLQSNILETEISTAARVAKLVFDAGLARVPRPADIVAYIRGLVYQPTYQNTADSEAKAA